MRLVIQRVNYSKCFVKDKLISQIEFGLNIFVGFSKNDKDIDLNKVVRKVLNLRIFSDNLGKMNKSIKDVGGSIHLISQFTLYGNTKSSNRPSFTECMSYNDAFILYNNLYEEFNKVINIKKGIFGEDMNIVLDNCGPVTILMEDI